MNIQIVKLEVSGDKVFVTGTVDSTEAKAETWLSHLYPPKNQDAASAARGCQDDAQRKAHLADKLLEAAGIIQKEELAASVKQTLQTLITVSDKPIVVVDPTVKLK